MTQIFFCKIFDDETGIPLSWLYEYEAEEDERVYNSVPRCPHCEIPIEDGEVCRDEYCMSHEFDDHGDRLAVCQ